jgi:hypothetical protein
VVSYDSGSLMMPHIAMVASSEKSERHDEQKEKEDKSQNWLLNGKVCPMNVMPLRIIFINLA